MGVVDDAVEDGIGVGRIADDLVPFVDGDLAGEDGRTAAVAFFEDFVEVAAGAGVEGVETPIPGIRGPRMRSWVPLRLRMMRA